MSTKSKIMRSILKKKAAIGIIGVNSEAVSHALSIAQAGFKTISFVTDHVQASKINATYNNAAILSSNTFEGDENDYWLTKNFQATANIAQLTEVDVIVLCASKQTKNYFPFIKTLEKFLPFLKEGQLILLEGDLNINHIKNKLITRIQTTGLNVGKNIFIAPTKFYKKVMKQNVYQFQERMII